VTEGHLDGAVARDATIAFRWDKVILQGLSDHMVTNQYFHCSIEISFQEPQGTKIGNSDKLPTSSPKELEG